MTLLPLVAALLVSATAQPPALSPPAGTYTSSQSVTARALSSGSIIRCTTDGSTPSLSSTRYTAPITVSATSVVKCRAWVQGKNASATASANYVINASVASSCANETMRATGTTYYVCNCDTGAQPSCQSGNDSNSGTSPSQPWQTWSRAITQFNTMAAGSTVAFCKGGAWLNLASVISEMRNTNCRPDSTTRAPRAGDVNTCDMRDYQAAWGGSNKPLLQFGGANHFMHFGWYEDSGDGWTGSKVQGVRILNLDISTTGAGQSFAIGLWGRTYNLEICSNTIRDGWDGAYTATTTMSVSYVNIHHNRITNNPYGIAAMSGIGCTQDCWVDNNYFDRNGGYSSNGRDHTIYGGGSPVGLAKWPTALVGANPGICYGTGTGTNCYAIARGARITNNEVRRSAYGPTGTSCNASAIVVHGPHQGLLIENNMIYEAPGTAVTGCYGIDQTAGVDMPGYFDATIFRRNQIYNMNGNGITVTNCQNCIIEDNLIIGGSTAIHFPQSGNRCTPAPFPPTAANTCSGQLTDSGGLARNNTTWNAGNIVLDNYPHPNSRITNNAVCSGGISPSSTTTNTVVAGNRVAASSCSGWFSRITTDPTTNDFIPAVGSVLIGAGNATSGYTGTLFQEGLSPWSPDAGGLAPDSPPTQGAARR